MSCTISYLIQRQEEENHKQLEEEERLAAKEAASQDAPSKQDEPRGDSVEGRRPVRCARYLLWSPDRIEQIQQLVAQNKPPAEILSQLLYNEKYRNVIMDNMLPNRDSDSSASLMDFLYKSESVVYMLNILMDDRYVVLCYDIMAHLNM